jgi:hypothetical protein
MTKKVESISVISESRKKFFDLLADYWKAHSLPGLSGYIDALLWLEQRDDWTQSTISDRLKKLFGSKSSYPTSVASVNRAIKANVQFGTVIRRGTHKVGYTYQAAVDAKMLTNMFKKFIDQNEAMMTKLSELNTSSLEKNDPVLFQAIQAQIYGIEVYNDSLIDGYNSLLAKIKERFG